MLLKWPDSGAGDETQARQDGDSRRGERATVAVRRSVAILLSLVSVGWIFLGLLYIAASSGFGALVLMLPHELAFVVLALVVPPAFAWLVEARLNAMTLSLRRLSQTLESETANALERVAGLDERIGRGARALGDAAQRSGEQADELSRMLDQRATSQQALLERIGELDSQIRTLGEVQAGRLGAAVSEAGRQTAIIEQALRTQVASADAAVEDVGKRARQIAETIGQPLGRLREESESATRQVAGAVQDIRNRVEALAPGGSAAQCSGRCPDCGHPPRRAGGTAAHGTV